MHLNGIDITLCTVKDEAFGYREMPNMKVKKYAYVFPM